MQRIVVDAGPFIHLAQIGEIRLLKQFSCLYVPATVISEISVGRDTLAKNLHTWTNLKIISAEREPIAKIRKVIASFRLQQGESDVLYLANQLAPSIILTDDLAARTAAERLGFEVHGTVGIITYAFRTKWLSLRKAEFCLNLLYQRSSLFVTYAIIEDAIHILRKSI